MECGAIVLTTLTPNGAACTEGIFDGKVDGTRESRMTDCGKGVQFPSLSKAWRREVVWAGGLHFLAVCIEEHVISIAGPEFQGVGSGIGLNGKGFSALEVSQGERSFRFSVKGKGIYDVGKIAFLG